MVSLGSIPSVGILRISMGIVPVDYLYTLLQRETVMQEGDVLSAESTLTGYDMVVARVYSHGMNEDGKFFHKVILTEDGQGLNNSWCDCEEGDSGNSVWYEDAILYEDGSYERTRTLSHGVLCKECRGILQVG